MPNYRRQFVPGGTFFFTVNLAERGDWLLFDQLDDLKSAWASVAAERPFQTVEAVILPDHIHAIWTLPDGDSDYAKRWMMIKARFSRHCEARPVRASLARKGEKGIWQRRFWEHHIRDDEDWRNHVGYCWHNPVKHGLVDHPRDWPYSSWHRDNPGGKADATP